METNIGIDKVQRKLVADELNILLADSYTLYLLTHNFHWNVTGERFRELHLLFEEQYTELAEAIDEIAERIRTLGFYAPGTYKAYSELSNIEMIEEVPSADFMLKHLVVSHEFVVKTCRKALTAAQEADDESSISLISDRMVVHEKAAWMLRASIA